MKNPLTIIAGQSVYEAQRARKVAALGPNGPYESEALCRWQVQEGRHGIIEATIVKSMYGYSVRYASGLQNFGLIASARARQVDGSFEDAVRFATRWQEEQPNSRFVTSSECPVQLTA